MQPKHEIREHPCSSVAWSLVTKDYGRFSDKLKTVALGQQEKAVGKIIPWQNYSASKLSEFFSEFEKLIADARFSDKLKTGAASRQPLLLTG